eukprot:4462660-Pyramimonas_sp.AAC.1
MVAVLRLEIGAVVQHELLALVAERLGERVLRAEEAHGEHHQVRGVNALGPLHLGELELAVEVLAPHDRHHLHARALAVGVRHEPLGEHVVLTGVVALARRRLLVPVVHAEDAWPLRPG